jgi:serine/threonine protein kinase
MDEGKMKIGCYELGEELGSGTFGEVYLARSPQHTVALKVASSDASYSLETEYYVLGQLQGRRHFPKVYDYGRTGRYCYMAMEPLGPSLKALLRPTGKPLNSHLWMKVWLQGLEALRTLHKTGYLHRDIKPHNILLGRENSDIYLIDFGLARAYFNGDVHIKRGETNIVKGTYHFASRNVINYITHSRRDDIESLVLSLLYLRNNGALTWSGIRARNETEQLSKIYREMNRVTVAELCTNSPREIFQTLEYVRGLEFEEESDYVYLSSLAMACRESNRPTESMSSGLIVSIPKGKTKKRRHRRESPDIDAEEATAEVSWTEVRLGITVKQKLGKLKVVTFNVPNDA